MPPRFDFRPTFAYAFGVSKSGNTLMIAASLIAAIRIAREERAGNKPNVQTIIVSSVNLAWQIYNQATAIHPEMLHD
jgi:hypothetical protein